MSCGKIILGRSLFKEFDCLELIIKLGEKGKKNRVLAINILKNVPQYLNYVIQRFSTETEFEFAFDIVQEFKLQLTKFPELQIIKQSRHAIVDMAFTDPETSTKYVPFHVMEDLISGD